MPAQRLSIPVLEHILYGEEKKYAEEKKQEFGSPSTLCFINSHYNLAMVAQTSSRGRKSLLLYPLVFDVSHINSTLHIADFTFPIDLRTAHTHATQHQYYFSAFFKQLSDIVFENQDTNAIRIQLFDLKRPEIHIFEIQPGALQTVIQKFIERGILNAGFDTLINNPDINSPPDETFDSYLKNPLTHLPLHFISYLIQKVGRANRIKMNGYCYKERLSHYAHKTNDDCNSNASYHRSLKNTTLTLDDTLYRTLTPNALAELEPLFKRIDWLPVLLEYLKHNAQYLNERHVMGPVLRILSILPRKTVTQFYTQLLNNVELMRSIYPLISQIRFIEIFDGGEAKLNLTELCKIMWLKCKLPIYYNPQFEKKLSQTITASTEKASTLLIVWQLSEKLSTDYKDYEFFRIQGRTVLLKGPEGKISAIKWQKKGEPTSDLLKQDESVKVLRESQEELGLKSEIPTPVGVFRIVDGVSTLLGKFKGLENLDTWKALLKSSNLDNAYIYETKNDQYFTYLHDPTLSIDDFFKAAEIAIHDLIILLKIGMVPFNITDMLHDVGVISEMRPDAGRYITLVDLFNYASRGPGGLYAFLKATNWPNLRACGLADEGDWQFWQELINIDSPLFKKYFRSMSLIHSEINQQPQVIQANFIAEYLFVLELLMARRLVNQGHQDVALWAEHAEKFYALCLKTLKEMHPLTPAQEEIFCLLAGDPKAYAEQLRYIISLHYPPDIVKEKIPEKIYGPNTAVKVNLSRLRAKNFRYGSEDHPSGFFSAHNLNDPNLSTANSVLLIQQGAQIRDAFVMVLYGLAASNLALQEEQQEEKKEAAAIVLQKAIRSSLFFKTLPTVPEKTESCVKKQKNDFSCSLKFY